jgi:hypothetical protein
MIAIWIQKLILGQLSILSSTFLLWLIRHHSGIALEFERQQSVELFLKTLRNYYQRSNRKTLK